MARAKLLAITFIIRLKVKSIAKAEVQKLTNFWFKILDLYFETGLSCIGFYYSEKNSISLGKSSRKVPQFSLRGVKQFLWLFNKKKLYWLFRRSNKTFNSKSCV